MLSKIEELRLISRCVIGDDRRAFGALVEAYEARLRQFFMSLTLGDAALSDDLAQDTFIKAYTGLRSFKGLASFGTWLYRIGYNEFCSYARKRREERADDGAAQAVAIAADCTQCQRLDAQALMAGLSADERTAVTLRYIADKPLAQIARIMQMPQGTVKSHLHRAKQKMRRAAETDAMKSTQQHK